jgi:hypothetical protein
MNNLFTPFSENTKKLINKLFINNGMIVFHDKVGPGDHNLHYYDKDYIDRLDDINTIDQFANIRFTKDNTGKMILCSKPGKIPNDTMQKILYDCSQIPKFKQLYVPECCLDNGIDNYYNCEQLFLEGKAHKIIYMNKDKEEVSYMITQNNRIMFA